MCLFMILMKNNLIKLVLLNYINKISTMGKICLLQTLVQPLKRQQQSNLQLIFICATNVITFFCEYYMAICTNLKTKKNKQTNINCIKL